MYGLRDSVLPVNQSRLSSWKPDSRLEQSRPCRGLGPERPCSPSNQQLSRVHGPSLPSSVSPLLRFFLWFRFFFGFAFFRFRLLLRFRFFLRFRLPDPFSDTITPVGVKDPVYLESIRIRWPSSRLKFPFPNPDSNPVSFHQPFWRQ